MRRWTIYLFLFVLAIPLFCGLAAAQTGGLRYTITVSSFENQSSWRGQWDLGHAWGTIMTDVLNDTGYFIVLGETDMRNEALAEQDFAASGRTAQGSKAPATGQMTPAQLLVKGAITHVQHQTKGGGGGVRVKGFKVGGSKESAEINATIYLVDSTTGQVVASTDVVGQSNRKGGAVGYSSYDWGADLGGFKNDNVGKAMESAISDATEWLIAQLPDVAWTGTVALVKDGQIYVNRGSREGVAAGQEFVVGSAEVIRDPDTGEILDEALTEVARLRVDSVKEKLSICSVTSGEAGAITRGMAVHLP